MRNCFLGEGLHFSEKLSHFTIHSPFLISKPRQAHPSWHPLDTPETRMASQLRPATMSNDMRGEVPTDARSACSLCFNCCFANCLPGVLCYNVCLLNGHSRSLALCAGRCCCCAGIQATGSAGAMMSPGICIFLLYPPKKYPDAYTVKAPPLPLVKFPKFKKGMSQAKHQKQLQVPNWCTY